MGSSKKQGAAAEKRRPLGKFQTRGWFEGSGCRFACYSS